LSYYSLTATIPSTIPKGGAIKIVVPSDFQIKESTCYNDAITGSLLNDIGFICNLLPPTDPDIGFLI
jgi:hypothetical protein